MAFKKILYELTCLNGQNKLLVQVLPVLNNTRCYDVVRPSLVGSDSMYKRYIYCLNHLKGSVMSLWIQIRR